MPGGPFNVGAGGFPVSHVTCCGILTNTSRADLRGDLALAANNVAALNSFILQGFRDDGFTLNCDNGTRIFGLRAILACQVDLVSMLGAYERHLDLPHAGPTGPIGPAGPAGPIGATGALGAMGFVGPAGELPTLGTPDFTSLLRTLAAALGSIGGRTPTTGRTVFPALPALPSAPVLQPVAPGGTVNLPVVPGSTRDPTGTRAPSFPDTNRERILEILRLLAPQIANEIAQRRAQRRARALIRLQLNAFREALAARARLLAQERRPMGFGQAGTSLGLQADRPRGSATPAGVGTGLLDILIQLGTSVGGDLLSRLSLADDPETAGPPGLAEQLAQLGAGNGGAATQCGLFRGGAATRMSSRPAAVVCLPDPITGEARFFGHLGRPLVFQRDVTMAKNIPKLIRKLGGHTQHRSKR